MVCNVFVVVTALIFLVYTGCHNIAFCKSGFGLVYLFVHSVTYVTLDTSITDYNLQHNL
jgi:hypothetical protein